MGQAEPRRPHAGGDRTSTSAGRTRARSGRHEGSLARMRWIGAGFPDYPWLFGVDGEYTAHASVSLGQFEAIEDHMRALREISDQLSDRSGVVVHEVVSDGSVWFGKDARRTECGRHDRVRLQHGRDRQVPGRGGAGLALDRRRPLPRRDARLHGRGLEYVRTKLDDDGDGWPEGNGNVERTGMGEEKLDNAVYYIRALYDFADMARSAGQDGEGRRRAGARGRPRRDASRTRGGWRPRAQYADSLERPGQQPKVNQKHWIGVDPMEAELVVDGETVPGPRVRRARLGRARHAREQLLQRRAARQPRPVPHGLRRRARRVRASSTSSRSAPGSRPSARATTARLGAEQQQRYTDANAETQFDEPATDGTPDEQPGAMPEIFRRTPDGAARPAPRRTSTAAGPAGRCSCRPGATTAPPGRSSTRARRAAGPRPRPAGDHAAGAGRPAAAVAVEHPARRRRVDVPASHTGDRYMTTAEQQRGGHHDAADRAHAAGGRRGGARDARRPRGR